MRNPFAVNLAPTPNVAPAFEPADPRYAERVRASFARQGAMRLVGAELLEVAPGYCAIAPVFNRGKSAMFIAPR